MVQKLVFLFCLFFLAPLSASADELDELIDYLVKSKEAEIAQAEEEAREAKLKAAGRNSRARLNAERYVAQEAREQSGVEKTTPSR